MNDEVELVLYTTFRGRVYGKRSK